MSLDFYKLLHFSGLMMVFSGLGGQIVQALNGNDPKQQPGKKWSAIFHGIGLLLLLVGGFGMLAKLELPIQGWVVVKLAIWIVIGGIGALVSRKKSAAGMIWVATILLGVAAAYLARTKGF